MKSKHFTATLECQHCKYENFVSGYNDVNYHNNIIPNIKCPDCGRIASARMKRARVDFKQSNRKFKNGDV